MPSLPGWWARLVTILLATVLTLCMVQLTNQMMEEVEMGQSELSPRIREQRGGEHRGATDVLKLVPNIGDFPELLDPLGA